MPVSVQENGTRCTVSQKKPCWQSFKDSSNAIQIVSEDDLLQGLHTVSSEPYFYDTGFKSSALKQVTIVDHDKRCLVTQEKCPK